MNLSRRFEVNPFIPGDFKRRINGSYLVDHSTDYNMLKRLMNQGINVGISSAVVIAAAEFVARIAGDIVVVPIFEKSLVDYSPDK